MNGAYSAEEVYTECDIQNVVQYAAAVGIPLSITIFRALMVMSQRGIEVLIVGVYFFVRG